MRTAGTSDRQPRKVDNMTASEKVRAKAEQAVGKAAQAAGRATGNKTLIAKGHAAEAAGRAREAKESAKDVGH